MPGVLYVAAGGGGDAIAAHMLHRLIDPEGGQPVIATWAWERLMVDPVPGPRSAKDFEHLDHPADGVSVITSRTRARPPSKSLMPRLADELDATLVLIDATGGCQGLARQLVAACQWVGADHFHLVDVGGDALGQPNDPGLRSPMADVSTVIATQLTEIPADLTIFGPGADGELPTELVAERLAQRSARRLATLTPEVARDHMRLLDWNPSEANALLIAAALGFRGTVEMRDQGLPVRLDARLAEARTMSIDQALPPASITQAIEGTQDTAQLREAFTRLYGIDEIAYEERKAKQRSESHGIASPVDAHAAEKLLTESTNRGTDWFTRRRLKEALHPALPTNDELEAIVGYRWQPPLIATR